MNLKMLEKLYLGPILTPWFETKNLMRSSKQKHWELERCENLTAILKTIFVHFLSSSYFQLVEDFFHSISSFTRTPFNFYLNRLQDTFFTASSTSPLLSMMLLLLEWIRRRILVQTSVFVFARPFSILK